MQFVYVIIPALLVLITAYLLIDRLLRSEVKRRDFDLRKVSLTTITPTRLRAYERLMLLLERTIPTTLVVNTIKPTMTSMELHSLLISTIRQEFAHNVSQQIYVSNELWGQIRVAQESLVQLINGSASNFSANEPAVNLAELIIKVYSRSENSPSELAIAKLKAEVRMLF